MVDGRAELGLGSRSWLYLAANCWLLSCTPAGQTEQMAVDEAVELGVEVASPEGVEPNTPAHAEAEAAPTPVGLVRVQVRDLQDQPIVGAEVAMATFPNSPVEPQVAKLQTDARGEFLVETAVHKVELRVAAQGLLVDQRTVAKGQSGRIRLALAPAATLHLKLEDAASRAGITTGVSYHSGEAKGGGWFEFGHVGAGPYQMVVRNEHFDARWEVGLGPGQTRRDLKLSADRMPMLAGRVETADGKPCAGGCVKVQFAMPADGEARCPVCGPTYFERHVCSDNKGEIRMALPPNRDYELEFSCPSNQSGVGKRFHMGAKDRVGQRWRSPEGGLMIAGRTVGEMGFARGDVEVWLQPRAEGSEPRDSRQAQSDKQGNFTFAGLDPGEYSVYADVEEQGREWTADVEVRVEARPEGARAPDPITLKLQRIRSSSQRKNESADRAADDPAAQVSVRGQVLRADGSPADGAFVYSTRRHNLRAQELNDAALAAGVATDVAGNFELRVDADTCSDKRKKVGRDDEQACGIGVVAAELTSGDSGFIWLTWPEVETAQEVELSLAARGDLSLHVLNHRGGPETLLGLELDASPSKSSADLYYEADGVVESFGLVSGPRTLRVYGEGWVREVPVDITPEKVTRVDLKLRSPAADGLEHGHASP